MRHIKRTATYLFFGTLFLSVVGAINYPSIRRTFESSPLIYTNVPFPVERPVKNGETIPVIIGRCNLTDKTLNYHVARTLYRVMPDGSRTVAYILPDAPVDMPPGCSHAPSGLHQLPTNVSLPPGEYVLKGRAITDGQWKEHHIDWETQPFTVYS